MVRSLVLLVHGFAPVIVKIKHNFLGARAFKIPASSMKPALEEGDYLIAKLEKYGDRVSRRGDIIVFPYPEDRSVNFVKRVIGLPGERIEIKDKLVFVNGQRLDDPWGVHEGSVNFPSDVNPRDNFGPVQIREGSVFVLGDNRDNSHDSRFWGDVKIKEIEGRAVFIYWSNDLNRIGKQLH
jgi:signal peptidase I